MFGHRYFGARYYGPAYWGDGGSLAPVVPVVEAVAGGGIHLPYREGERRRKGLEWDVPKRNRRKELEGIYDRIAGLVAPEAAAPVAELVQPFVAKGVSYDAPLPPTSALDWEALLRDQSVMQALAAVLEVLQNEEDDAVTALLLV